MRLKKKIKEKDLNKIYKKYYKGDSFIAFQENLPELSQIKGTNRLVMSGKIKEKTLVIFSALDNLMKGASGQAVQNANLMLGIKEETGLI